MSALIPFTAYFRVVPARGESKWDYARDLQRLGNLLYGELESVTSITLPVPGGGQNQLNNQFGSIANSTGVRPQIGNNPSLLMIEGFYSVDSKASEQPVAAATVIHCNEVLTGPRSQRAWSSLTEFPSSTVVDEVSDLKTALDSAAAAVVDDSGNSPELFRLNYKNITWGDHGHTFPA